MYILLMCNKFANSFRLSRLGSCWIFLWSVCHWGMHGIREQTPPAAFLYERWYQIPSNTEVDAILQRALSLASVDSWILSLLRKTGQRRIQRNRKQRHLLKQKQRYFSHIGRVQLSYAAKCSGLLDFGVGWREISC